jgi:hypothetical protein
LSACSLASSAIFAWRSSARGRRDLLEGRGHIRFDGSDAVLDVGHAGGQLPAVAACRRKPIRQVHWNPRSGLAPHAGWMPRVPSLTRRTLEQVATASRAGSPAEQDLGRAGLRWLASRAERSRRCRLLGGAAGS